MKFKCIAPIQHHISAKEKPKKPRMDFSMQIHLEHIRVIGSRSNKENVIFDRTYTSMCLNFTKTCLKHKSHLMVKVKVIKDQV